MESLKSNRDGTNHNKTVQFDYASVLNRDHLSFHSHLFDTIFKSCFLGLGVRRVHFVKVLLKAVCGVYRLL